MNRTKSPMIDAREALKLICSDPTFGEKAARKEAEIIERWGYFQVSTDARINNNRLLQAFSILLAKVKCADFLNETKKSHRFDLENLKQLRPHIRQLWHRHGRRPIFELHGGLIADLQDHQNEVSRWQAALGAATDQLRHWILTKRLVAWGRRADASKAEVVTGDHERIPPSTFLNKWTTFQQINEDGFWIACDAEASIEEWTLPRQCWGDIKLNLTEILRLHGGSFNQGFQQEKPSFDLASEKTQKPRKKTGLDYRQNDEPLVAKGVQGVRDQTYKNATDAGRALAKYAVGTNNEASRATRLVRQISKQLASQRIQ